MIRNDGFAKASKALGALAAAALVLAAAGNAMAAWDTPTDISGPGVSNGSSIDLKIDGKGRAVALWYETGVDYIYHLVASLRKPGGTFAGGAQISGGDMNANWPSIVTSKKGHIVIGWLHSDGSNVTPQVATAAPGAASFGNPEDIPLDGGAPSTLVLGMDGKGNLTAGWEDMRMSGYFPTVTTRPVGGTFSTPLALSSQGASGTKIFVSPKGKTVVTWFNYDGMIYAEKAAVRPAGGTFGPDVQLNDAMSQASWNAGAFDRKGNLFVGWGGHGATLPADSTTFDAPVSTPVGDNATQFAFDKKGNLLALWTSYLYTARFASRPAGGDFGVTNDLSTPMASAYTGGFAVDKKGNARAVWLEYDGTHNRVYTALRPAGGTFGTPEVLSPADVDTQSPRLILSKKGKATIAWLQSDTMGSNWRVMVTNELK